MNAEQILNTSWLFLGGAGLILKGIHFGVQHTAKESPVTLLTTGAILFPLATLIGIATDKIFEDMGWESNEARHLTTFFFTWMSSTALASGAAVGFGFTASLGTAWTLSIIALALLGGAGLIVLGIDNIYSNANHVGPRGIIV